MTTKRNILIGLFVAALLLVSVALLSGGEQAAGGKDKPKKLKYKLVKEITDIPKGKGYPVSGVRKIGKDEYVLVNIFDDCVITMDKNGKFKKKRRKIRERGERKIKQGKKEKLEKYERIHLKSKKILEYKHGAKDVEVLDSSGKFLKKIKAYKRPHMVTLVATDDVLITPVGAEPDDKGRNDLICVDSDGSELWRTSILMDDALIASQSADGKYLVIANCEGVALCGKTGRRWFYDLRERKLYPLSVSVSENGEVVALYVDVKHRKNILFTISAFGRLLSEEEVAPDLMQSTISSDGKTVTQSGRKRIKIKAVGGEATDIIVAGESEFSGMSFLGQSVVVSGKRGKVKVYNVGE